MSPQNTLKNWARLIYYLSQNMLSLIGVVLTTSSAITLIGFWIYDFVLLRICLVSRRVVHGHHDLLRTNMPDRNAAGIHRVSRLASFPRGLRRMPHRARCRMVREVKVVRDTTGFCRYIS
jgi:hypothetical protein